MIKLYLIVDIWNNKEYIVKSLDTLKNELDNIRKTKEEYDIWVYLIDCKKQEIKLLERFIDEKELEY